LVDEFEERLSTEVRRQEGVEQRWRVKLNPRVDEFRRSELLGKYITKLLFEWDNKKFEEEYLKKLERNWNRWKKNKDRKTSRIIWRDKEASSSGSGILKEG